MKSEFKRTDRIAELMQRELSQLIQREVKDPRLPPFITISQVQVSPDLSHAKVYFTVLNAEPEFTATILNTAASFLRANLAKSLKLRITPQLHFLYDNSLEYSQRLSRLIDKANTSEANENEKE